MRSSGDAERRAAAIRSRKRRKPRHAQNGLSDAANAMIGTWEFSNADHDRICHFNFRADAATGGYKLDIDKNCPNLFPSTKNIVAWSLDNYGDLRLLDARWQSGGGAQRGRGRHV